MIPELIEAHLREHYGPFARRTHAPAETASDLAASVHVTGRRVAKTVLIRLGGELAFAVVAATDHVNLPVLEEATALQAELVPEEELRTLFTPCDTGSEPALALFGLPIFVDHALTHEPWIVMAAGSHEDAVVLRTSEWMWCERVQPIVNLGVRRAPSPAGARAPGPAS
jgi:Ala-tRNA(Pro) deacylase